MQLGRIKKVLSDYPKKTAITLFTGMIIFTAYSIVNAIQSHSQGKKEKMQADIKYDFVNDNLNRIRTIPLSDLMEVINLQNDLSYIMQNDSTIDSISLKKMNDKLNSILIK